MGYDIVFGKSTRRRKNQRYLHSEYPDDVQVHPGKTPAGFADLGGEKAERSPCYGVWSEVMECIPELKQVWGTWDRLHVEDKRVFFLDAYQSTILPLEKQVEAVAWPELKVRLQWFFYWYKRCLKDYGKRAALRLG